MIFGVLEKRIGVARGVQKGELPVELPAIGEEGRKFGMSVSLPMHFLNVVFAGWLNRPQEAVIAPLSKTRVQACRVASPVWSKNWIRP